MAKNATNWFKKINAVLETIGGSYGKVRDKKTYGVMCRAVADLMSGKGVGGTLADNLTQNIAIRVGPRDFSHDGTIYLTRNQRKYARKMGWDNLPSFDELYEQQHNPDAAEEQDQDDNDLFGLSEEEAGLLTDFLSNSDATQKAALLNWIKAQSEPVEIEPAQVVEEVAAPQPAKATRQQDAITLWVKEGKNGRVRATGNIDIDGQKFCLNFMDFHSALDRIPENEDNASWRAFMAGNVADAFLPEERNADGVAACSTMSGLWDERDSFARNQPVIDSAAVVLEWQGAAPVRAHIFAGEEHNVVEIKQQTADRFKGAVRLAA